MRILIAEDEKKLARFIVKGFEQEGYDADVASDGETAAYQVESTEYDLLILDLMLPKLSGIEVLKRARARKPTLSIIILTARAELEHRIQGLDAGADDYLVKPFAFAELCARSRALMRRHKQRSTKLEIANLELNTATRTVSRAGKKIDLKNKEYALLEFLLRHANRPVSRTMITESVWDIHFDSISNVVDVHINSLRNKIDKDFEPPLIHTKRGIGYVLTDQEP